MDAPVRYRNWLLPVTAVAAALRLPALFSLDVHTDEAGRLASVTLPDIPFAAGAAAAWQGAVGSAWLFRTIFESTGSLAALRTVPFLAGVAAVFLFGGIVRRELDDRPALLAALLFAVLPLQVLYSVLAEEYAFVSLFGVAATGLALDFVRGKPVDALRIALMAFLGAGGLLFGGFTFLVYWLALAGAVASARWRLLAGREWCSLAAAQLPLLLLLVWTLAAMEPVREVHAGLLKAFGFDLVRSDPAALVADLWLHVNFWFWIRPAPWPLIAAESLIAGWLIWIAVQAARRPSMRFWAVLGVLSLAIPAAVYGAAFGHPFYFSRTYLFATVPLVVLLAQGAAGLGRLRLWGGILIAGALAGSLLLSSNRHPSYPPLLGRLYEGLRANLPTGRSVAVHPWILTESLAVGCRLEGRACAIRFERACHPEPVRLEDYRSLKAWKLDPAGLARCAEQVSSAGACLLPVPPVAGLVEGKNSLPELLAASGYRPVPLEAGVVAYCPPEGPLPDHQGSRVPMNE